MTKAKKQTKQNRIRHRIAQFCTLVGSKVNHINSNKNYPFVILLGIVAYELMKINFQIIFKEMHCSTELFDNSWILSSILGSLVIGLLSDRFIGFSWRKPIVLVGITFSFFSGIAFLFPSVRDISHRFIIMTFVLLNGFSGSYLGAIRAFYLDQFPKRKTPYFALTVIFQCISWIMIGGLLSGGVISIDSIKYIAPTITAIAFFLILFHANDNRESQYESRHTGIEVKEILYKYNRTKDWSIISSFFILAISYQLMPYLGEYTFSGSDYYQEFLILGLGVGIGVPIALLIFKKTSIIRALKINYAISFSFFLIIGVLSLINLIDLQKNLDYQFFIFACLGGIIWIISVKEFLQKSTLEEDGLILGFIESVQSLGEFAGAALSGWLTHTIILTKGVPFWPFLVLMIVAFSLISLESILKSLKYKSNNRGNHRH